MAAIRTLIGTHHKGQTIMVECDNSAAVAIFATGRGHHVSAAFKSLDINSRYEPGPKSPISPDDLDKVIAVVNV